MGTTLLQRRWLRFGKATTPGRGLGIGLVVGDQERGQAGGARMLEHEPPEAIAQRAVELAERLVEATPAARPACASGPRARSSDSVAGSRRPPARSASASAASMRARRSRRPRTAGGSATPGSRRPTGEETADRPGTGCRPAAAPGGSSWIATPSSQTSPGLEHRLERAADVAERLDLPQPLGPMTVVTAPGATSRPKPASRSRPPTRRRTSGAARASVADPHRPAVTARQAVAARASAKPTNGSAATKPNTPMIDDRRRRPGSRSRWRAWRSGRRRRTGWAGTAPR